MIRVLWFLLFSSQLLAQSQFQKAEKMHNDGNPQATVALKAILQKDPNHLETLELLGDVASANAKWTEALSYYQKLRSLKPSVANYHYKTGGALGMIAKTSSKFKAITLINDIRGSFEKAIEIDPKHIDAHHALVEYYLQLPIIAGGSEAKAKQYATKLGTISTIDAHLANGHIAEYYKKYAVAEKYYKSAIVVGKSKTAYQKLADLYKKMNMPQKAAATMAEFNRI